MTSERIVPLSEYHRLPKEVSAASDIYKRLLEVVCNNATLALFIMDEHQECIYMNPAAEALTGYSLSETKGRALHNVVHHTRPDGRPYPLCECPIDQAFPQNNQEQGEEVFVHKDGHFYPVAYTASPIREGDRVVGTIIEVRDITQEKLAEQAKQAAAEREKALQLEAEVARQRAETVLSSIHDGVFVLDRSWRYTYANQRLCEMAGKSLEELLGYNNWELFPAAVNTEVYVQFHRAMDEQVYVQFEYLYLPWNRWFEYRVYPSEEGTTIFAAEITDRKQAEIALHRSEERFRISQELSLDAFTILDSVRDESGAIIDFVWTYVNPKAADILQHSADELIGQRLLKVLPSNPTNSDLFKRYVQVVETGSPHDIELFHNSDDITRWFRNMAVKLEDGVAVFFSEITKRKQIEEALRASEERLRFAVEGADLGTWEYDLVSGQIIWSEQTKRMFGLTSDTDVSYDIFIDAIDPDDRNRIDAAVKRAIAEQEIYDVEMRSRWPDGSIHWVRSIGRAWYDANGTPIRMIGVALDTTERKQFEVELQESERRFRRLVESNMFGVAFGDFAGGMHYANDYFLNMVGYSREEFEAGGIRWVDITPPEFLPLDQKAGEELKVKGMATPFEKEYIRKDGTRVPILIGATLLDKPYEQAQEIITFYLDLTERKQVEAAWREGKQTLDAIMEYIPEGITIADSPDVRIRRVSKYGQQLTGRAEEVITNIPVTEHVEKWGLLRSDGSQPVGEELPLARAVLHAEVVTDEEWILKRPDESRINILCNAGPIQDQHGNITGGVIAWRDITERKQFEDALEQALQKLTFHVENTPMAVIEWDGSLQVTRWSRAAEHIFNWQADEVLGKSLFDIQMIVEEDIEAVSEKVRRLMSGEESYVFSYNRNYTKYGEVVHCEWYNSSLVNESGEIVSVLSLVLNVTDKKQVEAERERLLAREQAAREAAEAANRIKDEFLAVVSHELRAPLNPILGWSKLLRSGQLDAQKADRALEIIERNSQIQAQLINDLLDVSRILRGKLSLDTSPVDLVSTIQAAVETVRLAAEAKSIQLDMDFDSEVGCVLGDAGRLQQVVWNLVSNAVKFTSEGGQVEVCLKSVGSHAQITVRDTGKGIPANFLPFVFDHFRQESSATTRRFGGLGLGLAIVRHLVELHGGTVQASSPGEGQGATFTVNLPLMALQPATSQETGQSIPSVNLRGVRVLVAEDDDSTREFLVFLLGLYEAEVRAAATAAEALTTLANFEADILLSDIGMPDVDGYTLMRQVRALPPNKGGSIPSIALTAYAGEINYKQAMAAGFQRHLTKPVEPEILIQTISDLVEKRR